MRKAIHELPAHYTDIRHIHFSKDKKSAITVNLMTVLIALAMIAVMNLIVPISSLIPEDKGATALFARLAVLIPSIAISIILHEAIHGVLMKLFGCERLSYVFSGPYISAGCRDFFAKETFLLIALAPVLLIGIALNVFCFLVPVSWYWVFYILQIINIAGASGDYYTACCLFAFDRSALVCDAGTHVIVYVPIEENESPQSCTEEES